MASLSDLYVIAAPLDHPEGIATGPDGELYAGGEAGQVYRIDRAAGAPVEIANTGGFVLGLCLDAAGLIYLCNIDSTPAILRVDPATGDDRHLVRLGRRRPARDAQLAARSRPTDRCTSRTPAPRTWTSRTAG